MISNERNWDTVQVVFKNPQDHFRGERSFTTFEQKQVAISIKIPPIIESKKEAALIQGSANSLKDSFRFQQVL